LDPKWRPSQSAWRKTPKPVLQYEDSGDGDGVHLIVALVHHHGVALRYAVLRGGLVRGIEWNHHRDYSERRAVAAAARRLVVMEGQGDAMAREFTVKGGSHRRDDTHVCRNF
jgi:hypothetical protein